MIGPRPHPAAVCLALAVLAGAVAPVAAQCQTDRLANPQPEEDAFFGRGLAIEGDVMIVGVPGEDPRGAAWVYRRTDGAWAPEAKLLPTEGVRAGNFGIDVDLDPSGELAIVGAYIGYDPSASIFRRVDGVWVNEADLLGAVQSQFGLAVAIDGDVAVVGARYEDDDNRGAAYVYRRVDGVWQEDARLVAPDGGRSREAFGSAVALDGDVALIGMHNYVAYDGEAHVFRFDGAAWEHESTLRASDGVPGNVFGTAVDLDDDLAVVTALRHDWDGSSDDGAVYLFRFDGATWREEASFVRPEPFGRGVAARGDTVIVGGSDSAPASVSRFVRVDRETWTEAEPLVPSEDAFPGWAVGFDGRTAALGADYGEVDGIRWAGAVHLFDVRDPLGADCDGNGTCDAVDIAEGRLVDCDGSGVPDGCEGLPDGDGDGVPDPCDNCPEHPNPDQADCDRDGVGDTCAIAEGMSEDCDENGVPDECDPDCNGNGLPDGCDVVEGRSEDCNDNGVPDECDFDCNDNDVPDDCDIAAGTSDDCNEDGIPDECPVPYRRDDGTAESNYKLSPDYRGIIWLQQFDVRAGEEIAFGLGIVWFEMEGGVPATLLLYDDPNDDRDPTDGVLLRSVEVVTEPGPPDGFSIFPIPPTILGAAGDSFFVAATLFEDRDQYPMAADKSSPYQGGGWIGAADGGEDVDVERLDELAIGPLPQEEIPGRDINFMLRAYSAVDGVSCVPGDVDASGVVDFFDLLLVLRAWGACPEPPDACPLDLDDDGRVGIDDLLVVLTNWTT